MADVDNSSWFQKFRNTKEFSFFQNNPVAYFCAEFAISSQIPTYAGGLGILSADLLREASDQKFPLVCIGLYYHEGYIHKPLEPASDSVDVRLKVPENLGLSLLKNSKNDPLVIDVPIQDRIVKVKVWVWKQNALNLYFLDTSTEENNLGDQHITDILYTSDKETRLKQEIILGIGGIRLLEALNIHPSVFHANEGHSSFLAFELIKREMNKHKSDFATSCRLSKDRLVFTNHTLVAAGLEVYSNDLISAMFNNYAQDFQVPVTNLINLGIVQDSSLFSMTMLSLRQAYKANAVSLLHSQKAAEIWTDHPMDKITNGVHIHTWDKISSVEPGMLWTKHVDNKRELLDYVQKNTGEVWDPNSLVIGWSRRIVNYKRPLALFDDLERFKKIVSTAKIPIKVIFSGVPHGEDSTGLALLAKLKDIIGTKLKGIAVYLPFNSADQSKLMVSGSDIWLNTPVVGFEACGTSGMKAALNGVLPLSTRDGWIAEINLNEIGWELDNSRITESILDLLEKNIIPSYTKHLEKTSDSEWLTRMKKARELIMSNFSMTRVLQEYIEKLYFPVINLSHYNFKN